MDKNLTLALRSGLITREAIQIGRGSVMAVSAYIILLTVLGSYVDMSAWESGGLALINIATLVAGYFLVASILRASGLAPGGLSAGFGTYFGIGLITGLAIVVGLVLLIVPGVILLIRWAPVYGFGLVEGKGVTDAIGAAWESTRGHFWAILIALLAPFAVFLAGLTLYAFGMDDNGMIGLQASIGANLLLNLGAAMGLVVCLAVYAAVERPDPSISHVS